MSEVSTQEAIPGAPASSVTVQELDSLIQEIFTYRAEVEVEEKKVSEMNKKLVALQEKAVRYLKELGRSNYDCESGKLTIVQKWRVNLPQTDDDKKALFEYFREQGIFEKYATVNSNSLNSLFLAEWEQAQKEGRGMEFKMPGIGEPKLYETISMKRK